MPTLQTKDIDVTPSNAKNAIVVRVTRPTRCFDVKFSPEGDDLHDTQEVLIEEIETVGTQYISPELMIDGGLISYASGEVETHTSYSVLTDGDRPVVSK